jgi:hypothetical protein
VHVAVLFPVLASFVVLALAGVQDGVWVVHLASMGLALGIGCLGGRALRGVPPDRLAAVVVPLGMVVVAAPVLRGGAGPARGIAAGPVNPYAAPGAPPALLAACATLVHLRGRRETAAWAAMLGTVGLLASQPDASQALAFTAASAVLAERHHPFARPPGLGLVGMAVLAAWTFSRPNPLQPVAHVEGVFALAFSRSLLVGLGVAGSAVAFVAMLVRRSLVDGPWLSAAAAYYGVLFACSVAGLTPAPIIGFGAGPVLGYGALVAVSRSLGSQRFSEPSR